MAEKVKVLGIERDYKTYLYFIDGVGNLVRTHKRDKTVAAEVLVPKAVERDNKYLYYLDKDGDISRSARVSRKAKTEPAAEEPAPAPAQAF